MSKAHLRILHSDGDSGTSFKMEIVYQHGDSEGYIPVSLGRIKGGAPDTEVSCPLQFDTVCRLISVMRGDSADTGMGEGAVKLTNGASFAARRTDSGEVILTAKSGEDLYLFVMKPHEVLGVCAALEHAMFFLSFIRGITP